MKESVLKNVLVNLRSLFTINVKRRINCNSRRIDAIESKMGDFDAIVTLRYHYLNLLDYYANHPEEGLVYQKELDYVKHHGGFCHFPYPPLEKVSVEAGFDPEAKLPYVIHLQKRLYFPADHCVEQAVDKYKYFIQEERLLGDGKGYGAPHQYQSPNVHVAEGDLVVDIGAAEGLFALDQIERASHLVVVESKQEWMDPLRRTFAPYGDKVDIVPCFISSSDTDSTVSLKSLLSKYMGAPAFVKMDIEGYELPSLFSAMDVLKVWDGMKMAVASYHRQHDYDELKALFDRMEYQTESSEGYMLFHQYDMPTPPFFRHGVIRAKKQSRH